MISTAIVLASAASMARAAEQLAEAGATSIEAIVVTAERTNRTLRDTTSSVAVLTAKDAAERALQSTYDVLDQIPNFVANRSANNAPAVRGIDGGGPNIAANAFFAGSRPRLAFQVDGRTSPSTRRSISTAASGTCSRSKCIAVRKARCRAVMPSAV
jgi:outer membrane receptor protein involved in Fe transport